MDGTNTDIVRISSQTMKSNEQFFVGDTVRIIEGKSNYENAQGIITVIHKTGLLKYVVMIKEVPIPFYIYEIERV
jgi:transcription antitermination factor NusG